MERSRYNLYIEAFWVSTMKKIVIVGGGTAGWITALYAKKINPDAQVTLIESDDIGILGAGEGATPHLTSLFEYLEIPITELIKNCHATIKTSVKFTNWTKDKSSYHHPFWSQSPASNDYMFERKNVYEEAELSWAHYCAAAENQNLNDYAMLTKSGDNFQVPYILNEKNKVLEKHSLVALHFDARLVAAFLKSKGLERGIELKEGIVTSLNLDENEYITSLVVKDEKIECDFVFDCTGFKRLIIGNLYKSKWRSHSEYLPAKKAIPFFIEINEDIPPYTEAIAMKYGWMWKIPLQHRYGCGYVFDSDYISDVEAVEEIESFLGYQPTYPRQDKGAFNFSAGCYEKIWVKNCLAVGLSSGFIEPLEATSLMQAVVILRRFMISKTNLETKNESVKERFNALFLKETQEVVDFLYLHYLTNREDTDFWKEFKEKNKTPNKTKYVLSVLPDRAVTWDFDFRDHSFFESEPYNYILIGTGLLDKDTLRKQGAPYLTNQRFVEYHDLLLKQKEIIPRFMKHREFIDFVKTM